MELYEKVSTNLNFVEREKATRRFWEENNIFERSIDEGFIGNIFALRAAFPSREMFVAQKVFVRMLNTRSTTRVSAISNERPIAFTSSASKRV